MPAEKTFTQNEVNGLLATAKTKHKAEVERLTQDLTDHQTVIEAAKARVSELEAEILSIAGERDAARSDLEGANATNAQLRESHEAALGAHRAFRVEHEIHRALVGGRVLTSAAKHAAALLRSESEIQQDDDGKIVGVTYGGKSYASADEAAAAFLRANDYLASAGSARGGGSQMPNSGGTMPARSLADRDPVSLADEGLRVKR